MRPTSSTASSARLSLSSSSARSRFATLAAALIHGPALAGLGLAGAYVTPALVASETPNYWALVVYLAIVSAAALALASARRWRWLAIASVVLGVLWTFPGIGDPAALPAHLFHVAAGLALVAIFVVSGLLFGPDIAPGEIEFESSGALAAYLAAGAALVFATSHDPVALVGLAAMVAATLAIAWRAEAATLAVPAAALLVLLLFLEWSMRSHGVADALIAIPSLGMSICRTRFILRSALGLGVLFGMAGLRAQGRSSQALISIAWSASGALLPILLLMTLYWAATNEFERALAFALAGLATASLYSAATESLMRRPPRPGSATAAALYATAAVAALALTLTFSLDRGWLSVGLALMVPGIAWVHLRRPLPVLRISRRRAGRGGDGAHAVGAAHHRRGPRLDPDPQLAALRLRRPCRRLLAGGFPAQAPRRRRRDANGGVGRDRLHRPPPLPGNPSFPQRWRHLSALVRADRSRPAGLGGGRAGDRHRARPRTDAKHRAQYRRGSRRRLRGRRSARRADVGAAIRC